MVVGYAMPWVKRCANVAMYTHIHRSSEIPLPVMLAHCAAKHMARHGIVRFRLIGDILNEMGSDDCMHQTAARLNVCLSRGANVKRCMQVQMLARRQQKLSSRWSMVPQERNWYQSHHKQS